MRFSFTVKAEPYEYNERLRVHQLYNETFAVAFGLRHPFENLTAVTIADMDKQIYLRRLNCEYREFFANLLKVRGSCTQGLISNRARRLDTVVGRRRRWRVFSARVLGMRRRAATAAIN